MDIWKHGTYIDLWSVVHLLSGFILAGLFSFFEVSFVVAIIISIFILLLWEVFEEVTKIIEPSINVVIDIIIGFSGFLVGAYMFYVLKQPAVYAVIAALCAVGLAAWGFFDFLKRGYR